MAEFCTSKGSNAVTVTIKKVTKYAARFGVPQLPEETSKLRS
jgi:hypothetical protein